MKERILTFLQSENKSYAQFAEEIGVQPSGISHILSGRNNPSLDFVIKMLLKYPSLSAEWLLFGRGAMYKYMSQPTLFDTEPQEGPQEALKTESEVNDLLRMPGDSGEPETVKAADIIREQKTEEPGQKKLTRVLLFYSDKTFTEYRPG